MTEEQSKAEFERWIIGPPCERVLYKYGEAGSFPGHYCEPATQLAWEAWRAASKQSPCNWRWDAIHEKWDSECKNAFYVLDDTTFWPRESGFQFCPYCGHPIEPTKAEQKEPEV